MGVSIDGYGRVTITPEATPISDMQAIADLAYRGPGRTGTQAQRLMLTSGQIEPGHFFAETDTNRVYVRTGDGNWREVTTSDSGFVELTTFGSGWSATPGYKPWVRRVGNRVEIGGALTRTTTLGALASLVQIPPDFRITNPTYFTKFVGTAVTSTGQAVTLFYNTLNSHYLQVNNTYITNSPLGSGAVVPLSGSWFVD